MMDSYSTVPLITFPYLCTLHKTLLALAILWVYFYVHFFHWIHQTDLFHVAQNHNDHLWCNDKNNKVSQSAIKISFHFCLNEIVLYK